MCRPHQCYLFSIIHHVYCSLAEWSYYTELPHEIFKASSLLGIILSDRKATLHSKWRLSSCGTESSYFKWLQLTWNSFALSCVERGGVRTILLVVNCSQCCSKGPVTLLSRLEQGLVDFFLPSPPVPLLLWHCDACPPQQCDTQDIHHKEIHEVPSVIAVHDRNQNLETGAEGHKASWTGEACCARCDLGASL